ncbi:MAG: hypothetical protein QM484_14000 [Woeseiaceae bacterium]
MKNLKNYLLMSVLGGLTVACHGQRTDNTTEKPEAIPQIKTPTKQKTEQYTEKKVTTKLPLPHKTQFLKNRHTLAKQQNYLINQQKFSTKTGMFIRGAQLYNIALHQQVSITGAIVIVLYPNNTLPEKITQLGSASKIAKDTFKIKYLANQNMLLVYQQLKKLPVIKIIEMELDYTPQNKQALK